MSEAWVSWIARWIAWELGSATAPAATIAIVNTTTRPRLDAVLRNACERINSADARALLAHALERTQVWLFAHGDDLIEQDALDRFETLLKRRALGEPVAYLIGRRGFWSFDLMVSPETLIPRPETESLVELALAHIGTQPGLRIADLGTGSGAIALALAHECPQTQVIAVDVSEGALAVARVNAQALHLDNIEFRQGDWLQPLAGERFDLIASNPPYIADGDPHLDTLRYEPAPALSSGRDGLDAIRIIVRDAPAHLRSGGWLLLEHGWDQGDAVRALLQGAGFDGVQTHRDLEDRDRVSSGRWSR
jgi:release factor glutamine methyltransferase